MEEKGIITTDMPSPGVIRITHLDRNHPEYRAFVVPDNILSITAQQEAKNNENSSSNNGLSLEEVYKLPKDLKSMNSLYEGSPKEYYSLIEVRSLLWTYVAANNLEGETKGSIIVNPFIANNIIKANKNSKTMFISKRELIEKFIARLQCFSIVSRNSQTIIHKGKIHPIIIHTEKRIGRKMITRIEGLEYFMLSPHDLRTQLSKKFAASVALHETSDESKKEILIQGNVSKAVAAYLNTDCLIPKKYIEIIEPKKKTSQTKKKSK